MIFIGVVLQSSIFNTVVYNMHTMMIPLMSYFILSILFILAYKLAKEPKDVHPYIPISILILSAVQICFSILLSISIAWVEGIQLGISGVFGVLSILLLQKIYTKFYLVICITNFLCIIGKFKLLGYDYALYSVFDQVNTSSDACLSYYNINVGTDLCFGYLSFLRFVVFSLYFIIPTMIFLVFQLYKKFDTIARE